MNRPIARKRANVTKRNVEALLDRLADADAKAVHEAVLDGVRKREKSPLRLAQAVDSMRRTEYWRELGCESLRAYLESVAGAYADEADGLGWLWRLRNSHDALELVRLGWIEPEKLCSLGNLVTPATFAYWTPLLLHLTRRDLESVVEQYKLRNRPTGRAFVLVPIWMPSEWYRKEWAPHQAESEFATLGRVIGNNPLPPPVE